MEVIVQTSIEGKPIISRFKRANMTDEIQWRLKHNQVELYSTLENGDGLDVDITGSREQEISIVFSNDNTKAGDVKAEGRDSDSSGEDDAKGSGGSETAYIAGSTSAAAAGVAILIGVIIAVRGKRDRRRIYVQPRLAIQQTLMQSTLKVDGGTTTHNKLGQVKVG